MKEVIWQINTVSSIM